MYAYKFLIRGARAGESFWTVINADNNYDAKRLAESQYGVGSVLSYNRA